MARWTDKEIKFLEREYKNLTRAQIAKAIGRTESAVCTRLYDLCLRKTIIWTAELDKQLTENYIIKTNRVLAKMFGCSVSGIKNRAQFLKLNKGGNQGQFKKGQIPLNKGKKMDAETYEKTKHTFFKSGNIPKNHRKVGSVRFNSEGYFEIKTKEPRTWKYVHRLIWEIHHPGEKIGKNEIIAFIDGNKENLAIDNLHKIDRKQHNENCRMLTENVAFLIERDREKREEIIRNFPELIELKRNVLKLRKIIKYGCEQQN